MPISVEPCLRPELSHVMPGPASRDEVLRWIAGAVAGVEPGFEADDLLLRFLEREAAGSTATEEGVAFPHALLPDAPTTLVAVVAVPGGTDFGGDHPPARLVLGMAGPDGEPWHHVRVLARLARIVHSENARERLHACADAALLHETLLAEDRRYG